MSKVWRVEVVMMSCDNQDTHTCTAKGGRQVRVGVWVPETSRPSDHEPLEYTSQETTQIALKHVTNTYKIVVVKCLKLNV